ncbi:MAG: hypothetical protein NTW66_02960 [Candidatus Magasanikbacteria bacterium]|nr:hypothetical protein [Candidatus Magasanikbacteria bacterium]
MKPKKNKVAKRKTAFRPSRRTLESSLRDRRRSKLPYILITIIALVLIAAAISTKREQPAATKRTAAASPQELSDHDKAALKGMKQVAPRWFSPTKDSPETDPKQLEADRRERDKLRTEWMESAEEVAKITGDPQAREIIDFLRANTYLMRPESASTMRILETAEGKTTPTGLDIITEDDIKKIPGLDQKIHSVSAGAQYIPEIRVMVIYPELLGKISRGLVFLHEGMHAKVYGENRYDASNPAIYASREVDVHEFQNRLTQKIGGQEYQKILDAEVQKLGNSLRGEGTNQMIEIDNTYNTALDGAYKSTPISKHEASFRQTCLGIDAIFRLLEKQNPGSSGPMLHALKTQYMQTVYIDALHHR